MTLPEYRCYAKAVVERNHYKFESEKLTLQTEELRKAVFSLGQISAADSLIMIQHSLALTEQGKAYQAAQNEATRANKRAKLWRRVSIISVALLPVAYFIR